MNKSYLILLLLNLSLFASCEKEHLCDCFKSTGSIERTLRSLSSFENIHVSDNVNVHIQQGAVQIVEVESGENIIDGIITEVADQTLYVSNDNKCNWVRSYNKPMNVYVTVPTLKSVYQNGTSDIISVNKIHEDSLTVEVWSSGNVRLEIESKYAKLLQHVSVGDIELRGRTSDLYLYNNGNGFSYLSGCETNVSQIDHRGTGNCYVRVDSLLNYTISGLGIVHLYGNPKVNGTVTGGGGLVKQ
jgi:hypothetical protein